jgi:hypothetical protein
VWTHGAAGVLVRVDQRRQRDGRFDCGIQAERCSLVCRLKSFFCFCWRCR